MDEYNKLYGNEMAQTIRDMEIDLDKHFCEVERDIYIKHKQKLYYWPDAPLKHV